VAANLFTRQLLNCTFFGFSNTLKNTQLVTNTCLWSLNVASLAKHVLTKVFDESTVNVLELEWPSSISILSFGSSSSLSFFNVISKNDTLEILMLLCSDSTFNDLLEFMYLIKIFSLAALISIFTSVNIKSRNNITPSDSVLL
jgi:hypothetical protein